MRVTCPTCQAVLKVSSDHAGKKLPCPSCNSPVRVPDPESDADPRPAPSKGSPWLVTLQILSDVGSLVVWSLLILWCLWWLFVLRSGLKQANSAVQEASVSAMCAAFVVIGYAVARGIEVMLSRVGAWTRR